MISVICSVYNSEKYLPKYLKHVNDQFLKKFEIIFVDANSNDNSLQLVKDFKFRNDISIRILNKDSRITIYEAWNIAIKEASGVFIVNWNTDDVLFPSALQTYESYAYRNPNIDLFYSPCFLSRTQDPSSIFNIYNWPEYSHKTLLQRCICGPFPLVKKASIEELNYFNEKYESSGDYDMWLKLSKNNYKFKKIPEAIGYFLDRPDSVSKYRIHLAQQEDREIQKKHE